MYLEAAGYVVTGEKNHSVGYYRKMRLSIIAF